jgi:hypothetical protein
LREAHSYVMQGQLTQDGQILRIKVAAAGTQALELWFVVGPTAAQMIVLPTGSYLKANAHFWLTHVGPRTQALVNRWVQIPPASGQRFTAQLGQFAPATLSRCLLEDHGKLTVAGKTTVAGTRAIVIKDAGNVPGDAPGTLAVASTGRPYPLQVRLTGPKLAGGRIDVCNDGKADNSRGVLTLSQFGRVRPITSPPYAIEYGPGTAA